MKNDGWTNALFALVFLVVPGLILVFWVLGLANIKNNLWFQIGIGIGFIGYGIIFSVLVILIKWLAIDSLAFNAPITIVFGILIMTYSAEIWLMVIMTFLGVMTALPANSLVHKFKRRKK